MRKSADFNGEFFSELSLADRERDGATDEADEELGPEAETW